MRARSQFLTDGYLELDQAMILNGCRQLKRAARLKPVQAKLSEQRECQPLGKTLTAQTTAVPSFHRTDSAPPYRLK